MFASFSNHEDTKLVGSSHSHVVSWLIGVCSIIQALNKLHQLDVFGCRLVVEYASPWTAQHESVEDRLAVYINVHAHSELACK